MFLVQVELSCQPKSDAEELIHFFSVVRCFHLFSKIIIACAVKRGGFNESGYFFTCERSQCAFNSV